MLEVGWHYSHYTPIKGTSLESKPPISRYRAFQVLNILLSKGYRLEEVTVFYKGNLMIRRSPWLNDILEAFLTPGCPHCDRPFYNESPKGPIYNYPTLELLKNDASKVFKKLELRIL